MAGCVSPLEDSEDLSGAVTASFALSLKNTGSAQEVGTKMTTDITQSGNQNVFRGIESVHEFNVTDYCLVQKDCFHTVLL